jgi:UPF0176 protein
MYPRVHTVSFYSIYTRHNRLYLSSISQYMNPIHTPDISTVHTENSASVPTPKKISQLGARHVPRYSLLTFYKFVDIPHDMLDTVTQEHLDYTRDIGLHGRVYIGTEGISSTVTGNIWQLYAYRMYLENSIYFKNIPDIDAKSTPVDGHQFARMSVKIREEIVTMWHKVTADEVSTYHKEITIEDFKKVIDKNPEEYAILDMRNDYEYRLGHFKWAIPAGTDNFREVPALLEKYKQQFAGKKVVFYCTGGIRCEKASVIMNKAGMSDLYSLQWWVVKYVNEYNDGNWLWNLYTFDGRVSTHVGDDHTHTTIGQCMYTGVPTDHCTNCRYPTCNARMICTEKAYKSYMGLCSAECLAGVCTTGYIKSMPWDKYDYVQARTYTDWQSRIPGHLYKKLWDKVYTHTHSQKEREVVEC